MLFKLVVFTICIGILYYILTSSPILNVFNKTQEAVGKVIDVGENVYKKGEDLVKNVVIDNCSKYGIKNGKKIKNAFRHMLTDKCYSCPLNSKRTIFSIDSDKACEYDCEKKYKSQKGYTYKADLTLPYCYACDSDKWQRTLDGVKSDSACVVKNGLTDGCSKVYGSGWKPDILAGKCYKCPSGYNRNANPVTHSKSCTKGLNLFKTAKAALKPYVKKAILKDRFSKATYEGLNK